MKERIYLSFLADHFDGADHVQPHFDTAVGVVKTGFRQSADAIVAVAQQFDT